MHKVSLFMGIVDSGACEDINCATETYKVLWFKVCSNKPDYIYIYNI